MLRSPKSYYWLFKWQLLALLSLNLGLGKVLVFMCNFTKLALNIFLGGYYIIKRILYMLALYYWLRYLFNFWRILYLISVTLLGANLYRNSRLLTWLNVLLNYLIIQTLIIFNLFWFLLRFRFTPRWLLRLMFFRMMWYIWRASIF